MLSNILQFNCILQKMLGISRKRKKFKRYIPFLYKSWATLRRILIVHIVGSWSRIAHLYIRHSKLDWQKCITSIVNGVFDWRGSTKNALDVTWSDNINVQNISWTRRMIEVEVWALRKRYQPRTSQVSASLETISI